MEHKVTWNKQELLISTNDNAKQTWFSSITSEFTRIINFMDKVYFKEWKNKIKTNSNTITWSNQYWQ